MPLTFAERYEKYQNDPAHDGGAPPAFLALAAFFLPDGSPEELEQLALRFMPPDLPLIEACAQIEAEGGAA